MALKKGPKSVVKAVQKTVQNGPKIDSEINPKIGQKDRSIKSAEKIGQKSVKTIIAVTDNVVITACEDGVIRAVHLYPHRFVGM